MRTVILSAVLYGCENWYLTSKEQHTLRVQETECSGKYLAKRQEGTGEYRKLYSEKLNDLFSSIKVLGRPNKGE
jgi:hypothetical protein